MKNCDISLKLKQHEFNWGAALAFQQNLSADEAWYRNTIK